ncbi:MAG: hypothetical protein ACXVG9_11470 [Terriglobales bacterium]
MKALTVGRPAPPEHGDQWIDNRARKAQDEAFCDALAYAWKQGLENHGPETTTASAAHALYGLRERGHIKFGVLQNRKLDPPGDGCLVGFLEHHFANPLPVQTSLALLSNSCHVFTRFPNCA